ncbi:ABC transporter permease [Treponema sp. OMZ 840]|uniref:ABC transporter permease n=1 Tax=Treponema sp. OMZ 840 TaxID=244313 RepID=UPI003D89C8AF
MKHSFTRTHNTKACFFQWEWLLVLVFILIHIINSIISPWYLSLDTFISTPMMFLDKAFIVFPMMLILLTGNIDISVSSIVALSSVMMGVTYNAGVPMILAIVLCLITGTICGFINGFLLIKFKELPAMIITLSTMTIYRGLAYIILEDQAAGKFPTWFKFFGWGYVGHIPFIMLIFAICAIFFGILIHKTTFGRAVYGIGNNMIASKYSGIKTDTVMLIVYILTGLMSGITALFLTSRMGSTRPNIAIGYELEIIAMTVLGGVSTAGGQGRIAGPLLAIGIIGYLQYGLGLINISAQIVMIITGLLLIVSVMIQNIRFDATRIISVKK